MNLFGLLAGKENFLTKALEIGPDFSVPYYAVLIALVVIVALVIVLIVASTKARAKGKRVKEPVSEAVDVRSKNDVSEEEVIRNNSELRSDYVMVSGYVNEEEAFPEEKEEKKIE